MRTFTRLTLVSAVVTLGACMSQPPIQLDYTVALPSGLPDRLLLQPEDAPAYEVDAAALYRDAHLNGWHGCVADFVLDGLVATRDAPMIPSHQFGLEADAELAGRDACLSAIAPLVDTHGESVVQDALETQYSSELADLL